MVRTRSAKDYSPLTFVMIMWLQLANLAVAIMDGSHSLAAYFAVNSVSVLVTFILILRFRR